LFLHVQIAHFIDFSGIRLKIHKIFPIRKFSYSLTVLTVDFYYEAAGVHPSVDRLRLLGEKK
jgi:hypothetical protein